MRYASTWKLAAAVFTKSVTASPVIALTWLAYPSMERGACAVVTHQRWPGLAFSAMMAPDAGINTPSAVRVRNWSVRGATMA